VKLDQGKCRDDVAPVARNHAGVAVRALHLL
jgi:hypothetical protein